MFLRQKLTSFPGIKDLFLNWCIYTCFCTHFIIFNIIAFICNNKNCKKIWIYYPVLKFIIDLTSPQFVGSHLILIMQKLSAIIQFSNQPLSHRSLLEYCRGSNDKAKIKALNETVLRLSRTNEQLLQENKSLKEDLQKAMENDDITPKLTGKQAFCRKRNI